MMAPQQPKTLGERIWQTIREHQMLSGIIGAALGGVIALAALIVALNNENDSGASADSGSQIVAESTAPEPAPEVELDEDEDGLVDAVDDCPYEAGDEPSGCPNQDNDALLDKEDRCPEEAATTSDGCPAQPRVSGLVEYAEDAGYVYENTENAQLEQITVAGITDSRGVRMQVGGAYHSAAFTVFSLNRKFQWLQGRVGITSEPCSAGSVASVDVRDAEGQPLWPPSGEPKTIHRDSVPFKVRIASEDSIVLYAEAPETDGGYCGNYYNTTEVGWVHAELVAE